MHNNLVNIYKDYIAIIGAGISGLTLGIVLKKQNIPCIIFEKFPSISEYGAVSYTHLTLPTILRV